MLISLQRDQNNKIKMKRFKVKRKNVLLNNFDFKISFEESTKQDYQIKVTLVLEKLT